MSGALIIVEVDGPIGSDVEVTAIPEVVLDDIRFCAQRRGRTVWAEMLARLAGTQGDAAPPEGAPRACPPMLSGTRVRHTHPRPAAAR